jgi:hypothetical protein
VDLLALKGLREYARTSADLTPEGAKLVSDLCSAAIKIGNRINSDIFSSDFARTISAIRAMEAETGKRGEARYVSFMEEFQLAADRFNQTNPQKFLPPALLSI